MKLSIQDIAILIGADIEGDNQAVIDSVSKIEEGKAGSISFLANPKYESHLYTTKASAVIVSKLFVPQQTVHATLLRVDDPYASFTVLLEKVSAAIQQKVGVSSQAYIANTVTYGEGVYIGPFAYVGEHVEIASNAKIYPFAYIGDYCKVGENSIIYPHVSIYYGCSVGANTIIHSGATIGSDGFGFAPQGDGSYKKIPQIGGVVIEDNVEVGANTTIDRATMGATRIKSGTKLDNLVQVAHNVEIGEHTVVAAQSGISGSTKLGKCCMIGGQVGVVGHLMVADGTQVGAQSGVSKHVRKPNQVLRGSPAQPIKKQLKAEALIRRLDDMYARIKALEAKVGK